MKSDANIERLNELAPVRDDDLVSETRTPEARALLPGSSRHHWMLRRRPAPTSANRAAGAGLRSPRSAPRSPSARLPSSSQAVGTPRRAPPRPLCGRQRASPASRRRRRPALASTSTRSRSTPTRTQSSQWAVRQLLMPCSCGACVRHGLAPTGDVSSSSPARPSSSPRRIERAGSRRAGPTSPRHRRRTSCSRVAPRPPERPRRALHPPRAGGLRYRQPGHHPDVHADRRLVARDRGNAGTAGGALPGGGTPPRRRARRLRQGPRRTPRGGRRAERSRCPKHADL